MCGEHCQLLHSRCSLCGEGEGQHRAAACPHRYIKNSPIRLDIPSGFCFKSVAPPPPPPPRPLIRILQVLSSAFSRRGRQTSLCQFCRREVRSEHKSSRYPGGRVLSARRSELTLQRPCVAHAASADTSASNTAALRVGVCRATRPKYCETAGDYTSINFIVGVGSGNGEWPMSFMHN